MDNRNRLRYVKKIDVFRLVLTANRFVCLQVKPVCLFIDFIHSIYKTSGFILYYYICLRLHCSSIYTHSFWAKHITNLNNFKLLTKIRCIHLNQNQRHLNQKVALLAALVRNRDVNSVGLKQQAANQLSCIWEAGGEGVGACVCVNWICTCRCKIRQLYIVIYMLMKWSGWRIHRPLNVDF